MKMFKPVASKVDFPSMEESILLFWKSKSTFARSVDARRGGPRFTLYEGPPTANGNPGIHHVLARVFKDVIPRYKVMKGYYVPRIAGWDTHGLPVELEIEKKLGISNKTQIEEYGIARFNEMCKDSVYGYIKSWGTMTERIGYWIDLGSPYMTMDNRYMEVAWWAIKQLWGKGLIYQGYRVTPHCPRCGTSLSSHEVAQGYEENTEDPSVYIKFKVMNKDKAILAELHASQPIFLLAWTTTPWTLPGNTALAVSKDAEYAIADTGNEYLVVADELRERVGLREYKVVARLKGSDLAGARYEPLYNPHRYDIERRRPVDVAGPDGAERKEFQVQVPDENLNYRVIMADFVTMEEGTGIVHVAPAFGEADFQAGLENNLDFVQQVDLQGKVLGSYPFAGKFVKKADSEITEDLKARGLLYRSGTILHTYPFCWRCNTPLLYYAKQTWYIRTTALRNELIANNDSINWYPEHIKKGRFGDWLEHNVDWAFSRERYWGTPLPIWRCEHCGSCECIGSLNELTEKSGLDLQQAENSTLGLHRPNVDEIKLKCSKCGGQMERVPEVIDCWFDSGIMPMAQYHYPFDSTSLSLFTDGRFPADYICEAVDQTRGWFYSLHALSTLLFNQFCFKNVICLGHILDAEGEKMSKSRGNVVDPWAIINKYGADALRWYCLTATPPGNVKRFSADQVGEITRRFQLILWNVYSFFVTYANIDGYKPASELDCSSGSELDGWIISELNQLILDVNNGLDNYNPTDAGRRIEDFVSDLSTWYVRRSRRRFWKSENDADKIAAYNTLFACLVTLTKLLAPFMPFLAEALYQNLVCSAFPDAPDSVHLTDFPKSDPDKIDRQLSSAIHLAIKVASLGRAARSNAGIKVRQPLSKVTVAVKSQTDREGLLSVRSQILDELNVKDLELTDNMESLEKSRYTTVTEGDISVAICTEISAELQGEGLAREIVHRLQTMRRSAGFDIADYIVTFYEGDEYIQRVMRDFAGYVQQETLSRQLIFRIPEQVALEETFKLGGHSLRLAVKKETA
jgi:isoleucyl-tRNA synthetase